MGSKSDFTDKELLEMIRSGGLDRNTAFRHLCQDKKLEAKAFKIVSGFSLLEMKEDLLQDSLVIVLKNFQRSDFELRSSIHTYIVAIVKNLCFKALRRANKEIITDELPEPTLEEQNIENQLVELESQKEDSEILRMVLEKVGEDCAKVLMLASQKVKMREIARIMGLKQEQSAKTKALRCREKMRKIISEDKRIAQLIKNRI